MLSMCVVKAEESALVTPGGKTLNSYKAYQNMMH